MTGRYALTIWVPNGAYFGGRDSITTRTFELAGNAFRVAAELQARLDTAVVTLAELVA